MVRSLKTLLDNMNSVHNENTPTFLYSNNIIDLMISTKTISDKITNIETNADITSDHLMLCAKLTCMEFETANENEFFKKDYRTGKNISNI